jgi:signal peptidase I
VTEVGPELSAGQDVAVSEAPDSTRTRLRNALVEIITTVVLAVVIYLVVQTFVVQTFQVQQVSMVPTIQPGEHLLVDKLTPRFDDYSRGDVVVFRAPGTAEDETPFIKRIIGVGGDRVEIADGGVLVNGVALDEDYVARGTTEPDCGESVWNVPQGEIFLMGDHRNQSQDSRCFGTVAVDRVVGRAWLRFWPLDSLTILTTPAYPDVPAAST